jgi:hypothetical protein
MLDPKPGEVEEPLSKEEMEVSIPEEQEQEVVVDVKPKAEEPLEDVEIEVEADPLYAKEDWKKDPAELIHDPDDKDYGDKVKKRIGKLTAGLTEATRQRDIKAKEYSAALEFGRQQAARIAELEARLAQESFQSLQYQAERESNSLEVAKRELREAINQGDQDRMIAAQEKLSLAAVNAERYKQQAELQKSQLQKQPAPQQQQQAQQPQQQYSQKAQEWLSKNPWFNPQGGDPLSNTTIALHYQALAEGHAIDTDEYYGSLDKGLREKFPERFGVQKKPAPQPVSPVTPSARVAPVQTNVVSGGKIKLTQAQVNYAKSIGMDTPAKLKRFALEVAALEKGKR